MSLMTHAAGFPLYPDGCRALNLFAEYTEKSRHSSKSNSRGSGLIIHRVTHLWLGPFCICGGIWHQDVSSRSTRLSLMPMLKSLNPAQGFFLLKGSFSLPLLLVGGQALGVSNAPRDNFDCNRRYLSEYLLNWMTSDHFIILVANQHFVFRAIFLDVANTWSKLWWLDDWVSSFCSQSAVLSISLTWS